MSVLGRSAFAARTRASNATASTSNTRLFSSTVRAMASTGSAPEGDLVTYDSSGHARIYRLNRPKKLNSLNHEMITSLAGKMKSWRESDLCKLVVGMGNERAFCAGGDVAQLAKDAEKKLDTGVAFFKEEFELNWLMSRLGKPYVSIIDGTTMGGGAGIALPASLRIATPRTVFAMPETGIGYAPDVGSNYYLAQLDGFVGAWLAVTGQHIYGRTVYELGIATHYVPESALPDLLRQITHHTNPTSENLSKLIASHHISASSSTPSSKANPDGSSPITKDVRKFLDATFSAPNVQEIHKRLEAGIEDKSLSEEVRKWATVQKGYLDEKSPTGMAVALEGYNQARHSKRLDKVLKNDMTMATAFCGPKRSSEEFITGVTHHLINKIRDRRAPWEAELSSPTLKPDGKNGITQRFFTPSASAHPVPELNLQPSSGNSDPAGKDSTFGKFREWGLPDGYWTIGLVTGITKDSGAYKLTEEQLVDMVLDRKGERKGEGRGTDVVRIVKELIEAHCERDAQGYLGVKKASEYYAQVGKAKL